MNVKEVLGAMQTMQDPKWQQVFYINPSFREDSIGSMLLQRGKGSQYKSPIYCESRVKSVAERALSKIELVMVNMVFSCQRFCQYLLP